MPAVVSVMVLLKGPELFVANVKPVRGPMLMFPPFRTLPDKLKLLVMVLVLIHTEPNPERDPAPLDGIDNEGILFSKVNEFSVP